MDYIDYRKALGIGFDDEEKVNLFKVQFLNYFDDFTTDFYDPDDYREFCNKIGVRYFEELFSETLFEACKQLSNMNGKDFIYGIVAFYNTLSNRCRVKHKIYTDIKNTLKDCDLAYSIETDRNSMIIVPRGAKELDDALVSEPLEWLRDYPKTHATFSRALKQYSDGEYARDVADNFRKALEEFFQEFLGNTCNLANNKTDICKYLGTHNAEPEIASMMQALLNSYDNLNNSAAKHNDKLDSKYLEFLMYQTGLFIRMIITVGKEE